MAPARPARHESIQSSVSFKDDKAVAADESPALPKVKLKVKKSRRAGDDDIFTAFGQEYVDAGNQGDTLSRSLNVRRHWKSEPDIRRWHQDLADSSRLDKLLFDARSFGNPDFGTQQAELVQKHNALFRQRGLITKERSGPAGRNSIAEVRQMATVLAPKPKVKKQKKTIANFQLGLGDAFRKTLCATLSRAKLTDDPCQEPGELQKDAAEVQKHVSEEAPDQEVDAEEADDLGPGSARDMFSEDFRSLDRSADISLAGEALSKETSSQFGSTSMGFFHRETSSSSSLREPRAGKRPQTVTKDPLPNVLPRTMTLLLYRNGDKHHTGEVVFVHRRPKDMKELLERCDGGCRVMVGPPDSLYDTNMRQVKTLKDVEAGGIFLLKGKENLDPPPGFIMSGQCAGQSSGSMKNLTTFQRTMATNAPSVKPRTAGSRSAPSLEALPEALPVDVQRLPSVSGGSLAGLSSSRREGETWGITDTLSWQLSYGGQIGMWSGRHHDYSKWPRAPVLSGRSSASAMRSTQ